LKVSIIGIKSCHPLPVAIPTGGYCFRKRHASVCGSVLPSNRQVRTKMFRNGYSIARYILKVEKSKVKVSDAKMLKLFLL